jgi:hypothetical protein
MAIIAVLAAICSGGCAAVRPERAGRQNCLSGRSRSTRISGLGVLQAIFKAANHYADNRSDTRS